MRAAHLMSCQLLRPSLQEFDWHTHSDQKSELRVMVELLIASASASVINGWECRSFSGSSKLCGGYKYKDPIYLKLGSAYIAVGVVVAK